MPGQYGHTPVTWRKSPSQCRRDRQRFTNYANAQNNSHQGAHFDSYRYNENMDIVNENSAQVCEYSTNSQFHLNDNATINPSLNSIHVGQVSCEDQVVNSMSEIPASIDTNLDVNNDSSDHLLYNNTTHMSKESNDHADENITSKHSDEEGDTSKDSDDDSTVSIEFKPTGTKDDFDKIVMDFRQCEMQAFLRGLVKDGRITEIVIGASDGSLNVVDRNNGNKSKYEDLHAFINRAPDCKGNYSYWDETADRMFVLWKNYLKEMGEIT